MFSVAATATFAFIRQLFTSISIVIGSVVFQNGMEKQYPELLKQLGPDAANLLSGSNAASSVGLVNTLPDRERQIAREAYFESLRTMYIMYVVFAGVGLLVGFLVGSRKLSKVHTEHKTGLHHMKRAKQGRSDQAAAKEKEGDEEKGASGDVVGDASASAGEKEKETRTGPEDKGVTR